MAKFRRLKDLKHSKKNRYRERQTEIEREGEMEILR